MYMHHGAFFICQLPSCNLFTQHVIYLLWRDTTSELWTPFDFYTLIIQPTANHCSLSFSANKHSFSTIHPGSTFSCPISLHHTSNPLFSARPVRLTTSLFCWGKVVWLCAGSTFVVDTGSAPCQSHPPTPSEVISFSY